MATNIVEAVRRIKSDVAQQLDAATILRICRELNHSWRERLLGPVTTVQAFLLQVLHGNLACNEVPHLMGQSFTGRAYGLARARLPLELFDRFVVKAVRRWRSGGTSAK